MHTYMHTHVCMYMLYICVVQCAYTNVSGLAVWSGSVRLRSGYIYAVTYLFHSGVHSLIPSGFLACRSKLLLPLQESLPRSVRSSTFKSFSFQTESALAAPLPSLLFLVSWQHYCVVSDHRDVVSSWSEAFIYPALLDTHWEVLPAQLWDKGQSSSACKSCLQNP